MTNFTYELGISETELLKGVIKRTTSKLKNFEWNKLEDAKIEFEDLGFSAYIKGMLGTSRWNASAINIILRVHPDDEDELNKNRDLKLCLLREFENLTPLEVGYDYKTIEFRPDPIKLRDSLVSDGSEDAIKDTLSDINVLNPDEFKKLSNEVYEAIKQNKHVFAIDRLHTYSMKFFRVLCEEIDVDFEKETRINVLFNSYMKYLINLKDENENDLLHHMSKAILNSSRSALDGFDNLRNTKSYAHDNEVLNNEESSFICRYILAVMRLVLDLRAK